VPGPPPLTAPPRRGKRRWEPRSLLDGILWLMRSGASWREIPSRFAPCVFDILEMGLTIFGYHWRIRLPLRGYRLRHQPDEG